ncbi:MAG: hypothetical protein ABIW31_05305, partial [Novosphingobium sp.]
MIERRTLLRNGLVAGALVPFLHSGSIFAETGDDDAVLATVNPQLRDVARKILQAFGKAGPATRANLAARRASIGGFTAKPLADVPFEKRIVPGTGGRPDLAV